MPKPQSTTEKSTQALFSQSQKGNKRNMGERRKVTQALHCQGVFWEIIQEELSSVGLRSQGFPLTTKLIKLKVK